MYRMPSLTCSLPRSLLPVCRSWWCQRYSAYSPSHVSLLDGENVFDKDVVVPSCRSWWYSCQSIWSRCLLWLRIFLSLSQTRPAQMLQVRSRDLSVASARVPVISSWAAVSHAMIIRRQDTLIWVDAAQMGNCVHGPCASHDQEALFDSGLCSIAAKTSTSSLSIDRFACR